MLEIELQRMKFTKIALAITNATLLASVLYETVASQMTDYLLPEEFRGRRRCCQLGSARIYRENFAHR